MMISTLAKLAAACLLVALGAACGMSSVASSTEVGGSTGPAGSNPPDPAHGTDSEPAKGTTLGATTKGASDTRRDDATPTPGGGSATTPPVNLRAARTFAILSKGGISIVPTGVIKGNLGVSPAAATYITGFSLTADASNVFAISDQVTGKVYAADYALPTPSNLTAAIGDMELAFTDAASRAPDFIELGAGDIGGLTLTPGVYKWGTGVVIPTSVTLTGSATDVWIFQIAQTLTMSSATKIVLKGGAVPRNVFWQVAGFVELGTTAHFEGTVLSQTSVTLGTGASLVGSLLAQTEVNVAADAVVESAP